MLRNKLTSNDLIAYILFSSYIFLLFAWIKISISLTLGKMKTTNVTCTYFATPNTKINQIKKVSGGKTNIDPYLGGNFGSNR